MENNGHIPMENRVNYTVLCGVLNSQKMNDGNTSKGVDMLKTTMVVCSMCTGLIHYEDSCRLILPKGTLKYDTFCSLKCMRDFVNEILKWGRIKLE